MKNRYLLLLGLALGVWSCRMPDEPAGEDGPPAGQVRLSLIESAPSATKMSGLTYALDEAPVNHWAYFVFERSTGSLAYRGTVEQGGNVTRTFRTGVYELCVMANYPVSGEHAPDLSSIRSMSDFQGLKAYLADQSLGSLAMAGLTLLTVQQTEGDEVTEVEIHLRRLVSKVTLDSVSRNFTNASLAEQDIVLKHVYLTNVYPETRYAGDYGPEELSADQENWYNAMGWHSPSGLAASLLIDSFVGERDVNLPLPQGSLLSLERSFYFCPNPVLPSADSHESVWNGPRCTRLILETELGGWTYYYQASLPKEDSPTPLSRNTAFRIRCTLTGLGSLDPEQDIPGAMEVCFEAETEELWDATNSVHENS